MSAVLLRQTEAASLDLIRKLINVLLVGSVDESPSYCVGDVLEHSTAA